MSSPRITLRLLAASVALGIANFVAAQETTLDNPIPAHWSSLNPQARLIALRAARTDARLRIAEQIQSIELAPGLHVRDLAVASDMLAASLHEVLRGCETTRETLRDDLWLAEATLSLPAVGVRSALKAAVSFAQSPRFSSEDLRQRLDAIELSDVEADGVGAPPWPYVRAAARGADGMPEWACGTIEAFASAEVDAGDAASPSSDAAPAAALRAEAAARERLAARLAELVPSPRADRETLAGAAAEARVTHTRVHSDGVEVTVQLSGARLWVMTEAAKAAVPPTTENQP